ncbi:hypothetical protein GH714_009458 [Hevea brasiliensis]|uniref:AAA+ ATPase domain-containing protein n=1 Tax=Hevea brasiliensis TaxID=3981 RepID=A0A6A6LQY0_HEVBR|nr:hypothetical protein GH714_009458 [Hevea brasiliensis]
MIVEYTLVPIKRHLSYAFNCANKVDKLKNHVEELKNQRDGLGKSVDEAKRRGNEKHAHVENFENWLDNVDKAIEEAEDLITSEEQAKERCLLGLIPDLKKRYQLHKEAEKKALKVGRKAYLIQFPTAPSSAKSGSIWVYGMSGVGKTTLAKEVHKKAIEEKLFDVVVMVTVSETPNVREIQGMIADVLGLKFEEESEDGRADRLHQRLENDLKNEKKILVILDDIWEQLKPKKVGIPFGNVHKGYECVLRDASVIGELKRLEVLSFRRSMIGELPREIAHLTRLKLFDLSNCDKLKVIPANVISRLFLLEELYMHKSFCQWELQGLNKSNNASLAELKNLSRLTTLEIDVPDVQMLPKDLFSNKLERYDIVIGEERY